MHTATTLGFLRRRRAWLAPLAAGLALTLVAPGVLAQCQTNQNCWPPPGGCAYPAAGPTFYPLFVAVGIRNLELHDPNACAVMPTQGGSAVQSFFDVFVEIQVSTDAGQTWTSHSLANRPCGVRILPPVPVGQDLVFDTEMLQLELQGLPNGMLIRESPTLASNGRITQTSLGGGLYRIDCFFDVFTEISPDGGQGWLPAGTSLRMTTIDRAPTASLPGSWGTVKVMYR